MCAANHMTRVSNSIDLLFAVPPPENRLRRRPVLLRQHGRFWLRSTLHSYCTDSVARWSPRAPLSCVNSVRGLSEPPELHQRLGSGSLGRFAERPAGGGRHVGGLRLQRAKPVI